MKTQLLSESEMDSVVGGSDLPNPNGFVEAIDPGQFTGNVGFHHSYGHHKGTYTSLFSVAIIRCLVSGRGFR